MLSSALPFELSATTLETARLSIRIDTEEAYVHGFRTRSDAEIKAHFGIVTDEELGVQKAKISGGLSTYRTSVVFFFLRERSLDKVIGSFAFHNWYPQHRRAEAGYAMAAPQYMGMGYMSEAVAPIIAFGFEQLTLNRMEAFIHPENIPSIKLAERLGFQREGRLQEHYCKDGVTGDSIIYSLLHKNYSAVL